MSIVIHQAYHQIDEATLDAVQTRIGRVTPAAYRRFSLDHNGRQEPISIEWFLPVNTQEAIDLEAAL